MTIYHEVGTKVQYISSDDSSLSSFVLPIPKDFLVYSKDLHEFKKGVGDKAYDELDVFLDIDVSNTASGKKDLFPPISVENAGKMLSTKDGKLEALVIDPSNLITDDIYNDRMSKHALKGHTHNNYATKAKVDNATQANDRKIDTQHFLSYVLLSKITSDSFLPFKNPRTIIDPYKDLSMLEQNGAVSIIDDSGDKSLSVKNVANKNTALSIMNENTLDITITTVDIKTESDEINAGVKVYVSRGNDEWVFVPLKPLGGIYKGYTKYDQKYTKVIKDLITLYFLDHKGSNTVLEVDTENTSGHVASALVGDLTGCKITLGNGKVLTITSITNGGTANNSIVFTGTATTGPNNMIKIEALQKDNNNNVTILPNTNIPSLLDIDYVTASNPKFLEHVEDFIGSIETHSGNYFIYKKKQWRNIVKQSGGIWYYIDNDDNWIQSPVQNNLYALNEAYKLSENQMSLLVLKGLMLDYFDIISTTNIKIPNGYSKTIQTDKFREFNKSISGSVSSGKKFRYKIVNTSDSDQKFSGIRVTNK